MCLWTTYQHAHSWHDRMTPTYRIVIDWRLLISSPLTIGLSCIDRLDHSTDVGDSLCRECISSIPLEIITLVWLSDVRLACPPSLIDNKIHNHTLTTVSLLGMTRMHTTKRRWIYLDTDLLTHLSQRRGTIRLPRIDMPCHGSPLTITPRGI